MKTQPHIFDSNQIVLLRRSACALLHTLRTGAGSLLAAALVLLPVIAQAQAGAPVWTNHFTDEFADVAIDASGNVFVTGSLWTETGRMCTTIKYSSAGVPLWTNLFSVPEARAWGISLVLDTSGNVIVMGGISYPNNPHVGFDWLTIKCSNAGVPLWSKKYNGTGNGDDRSYGLAVDSGGNILVMGVSDVLSEGFGGTAIKYSSAGVTLWTNVYSKGSYEDLAVDTSGTLYVLWRHVADMSRSETLKISSTGVMLSTNINPIIAFHIALDSTGNVYLAGNTSGNSSTDLATIKYSPTWVPLWTNLYNGPGNGDDSFPSDHKTLALDADGNVVVAGLSQGAGTGYDYVTIKYSSAGLPLWTNRYNGPVNGADYVNDLAVDTRGNVYVTGGSKGTSTIFDYATVGYSSAGMPLWTNRYHGAGNDYNVATAIAVDTNGNVVVTGFVCGDPSGQARRSSMPGSLLRHPSSPTPCWPAATWCSAAPAAMPAALSPCWPPRT